MTDILCTNVRNEVRKRPRGDTSESRVVARLLSSFCSCALHSLISSIVAAYDGTSSRHICSTSRIAHCQHGRETSGAPSFAEET